MKSIQKIPYMLFLISIANAQIYTPPLPPNQSSANNSNLSKNSTTVNQNSQPGGNQFLGNDFPFFDPSTNTFEFDGKKLNAQNNQLFRSRFEKYLNTAASGSESDKAYRAEIQNILNVLSPHNRKDQNPLRVAVARLPKAATFPQDGKNCDSLTNVVYRAYLTRKSSNELLWVLSSRSHQLVSSLFRCVLPHKT